MVGNMKSATENRKPYSGLTRSLVIAIDVGTTFSGVRRSPIVQNVLGLFRFLGVLRDT